MRRFAARMAARAITSAKLRGLSRALRSGLRRARLSSPVVRYFHDPIDPYSQLAAQFAPRLAEAYEIRLETYPVSPPDEAAAPDRARLAAYSERDAALLAQVYGLGRTRQPPPIGAPPSAAGDALRARLGHYLGATFYFEGEWFWGLDRLPYLERRLAFARRPGAAPLTHFLREGEGEAGRASVDLDFFLSFRSPYTYLAAARVSDLARRWGARLRLRFVLPMVMRGLPVPLAKRLYIVRDAKREAERWGLPFGDICDPVGAGAERGLAVLNHAIEGGRGEAFVESFLRGVFAEGEDASTDAGLCRLAARVGIGPAAVRAALEDESWRETAERNRQELFDLGLWGVPSFRVAGRPPHWGQDRLWAVEADLRTVGAQATENAA